MSQLIYKTETEKGKQEMVSTIKNGFIMTWQHINLQGEYDFSEKTLENSYDFRLTEILDLKVA